MDSYLYDVCDLCDSIVTRSGTAKDCVERKKWELFVEDAIGGEAA